MLTCLLPIVLAQTVPEESLAIPQEETVEVAVPDRGQIEFDSRLPAEIRIDGQTVAQLYQAGTLRVTTDVGGHQVMVLTNGRAREVTAEVSKAATAVVLIGRNGLTTSARLEPLPEEDGMTPIELRSVGTEEILVEIGKKRYRMPPGSTRTITVPIGRYRLFLRSASGQVLWAKGFLDLTRTSPVMVQFTEGRMPEVSGPGSSFISGT